MTETEWTTAHAGAYLCRLTDEAAQYRWAGIWPVVNAEGRLTGEITEGEDGLTLCDVSEEEGAVNVGEEWASAAQTRGVSREVLRGD